MVDTNKKSTTPIKRVFIADPSFQDWLGHHASYDLAVSEGLVKCGVEVIILANKVVTIDGVPAGVSVDKIFSRTAWGVKTSKYSINKISHKIFLLLQHITVCLLLIMISPAIVFYIFHRVIRKLSHRLTSIAESRKKHKGFRKWLSGIYTIVSTWIIPRFVKNPPAFLKMTIDWCVPPIVITVLQAVKSTISEIYPPHWAGCLISRASLRDYYELVEALDKYKFGAGDVIFAHMITAAALPLWALFASRISHKKNGSELILLFRYTCNWMSPNHIRCKIYFRLLERAFSKGGIRGATDSALLAAEYSKHLILPLVVYPIPHIQLSSIIPLMKPDNSPLKCVSLGNARAEKGIIEIIEAIRIINKDGFGNKFHFDLQVNDPDEFCGEEIKKFINESPANVNFHGSALSPQQYEKLLNDADVVLAPYWNDIYFSRTSGIMLEALAIGKIIVSTKDTWMEKELIKFDAACEIIPNRDHRALANALLKIIECFEQYLPKTVMAAKKAREFHNSHVMAKNILRRFPRKNIHPGDSVLICYPWGDCFQQRTGASTRVAYLAKILNAYNIKFFLPPQENINSSYRFHVYPRTPRTFFYLSNRVITKLFSLIDRGNVFLILYFLDRVRDRNFRLQALQNLLDTRAVIVEYPFYMQEIVPLARALDIPVLMTAHDRFASDSTNSLCRKMIDAWEIEAASQADAMFTVAQQDHIYFKRAGINNILSPNASDIIGTKKNMKTREQARTVVRCKTNFHLDNFLFFVGSSHPPNLRAKELIKNLAFQACNKGLSWQFVIAGTCTDTSESIGNFYALGSVDKELLWALYSLSVIFISPLPGGTGASVKTVEAMGAGKVVFGSTSTFRGLQVTDGVECFIEDDIENYIPRLEKILSSSSAGLLQEVSERAEKFAAAYDYRICLKPYVDFIEHWPNKE
jgi:glycosyltransferase involved in cell wall biosynthesis